MTQAPGSMPSAIPASADEINKRFEEAEKDQSSQPNEEEVDVLNQESLESSENGPEDTESAISQLRALLEKFNHDNLQESERISNLLTQLEERLGGDESRIGGMDEKIGNLGHNAELIDERVEAVEGALDSQKRAYQDRFEGIDSRLNQNNQKMGRLGTQIEEVSGRVGQVNQRMNTFETTVEEKLREKDDQINQLLALIKGEQDSRLQYQKETEEKAKKSKWKTIIGIAGAAIGFSIALTNPVGWGVIAVAGIGGMGLNLASKKMAERVAIDNAEILREEQNLENINRMAQNTPADTENGQLMQVLVAETVKAREEKIEKLKRKTNWMGKLATAFEYTAPGLTGFAMGAGFGNFVHRAVENIATQAVSNGGQSGAGLSNSGVSGGKSLGAQMGGGNLPPTGGELNGLASQGGHLNIPGSPWNNTVLGMGPNGATLPGGEWNPSNYIGGNDGMAATFFNQGVQSSGAPSFQALFPNPIDATQVLNAMKVQATSMYGSPTPGGVDFAKAYLEVMGKPVPSF